MHSEDCRIITTRLNTKYMEAYHECSTNYLLNYYLKGTEAEIEET